MIVSHKHKFIFIKTIKTASSSIEVFLHPHCGPNDIITRFGRFSVDEEAHSSFQNESFRYRKHQEWLLRLTRNGRKALRKYKHHGSKYYPHMSAWEIKKAVGRKVWNEYYKFCVVRNPYDKAVSHYFHKNEQLQSERTFDQYLDAGVFGSNTPLFCDWRTGEIMVDEVVRYENLNKGLASVFQKIGIPFSGELNIYKKSKYRPKDTDYRTFLTEEQKARVSIIHQKEIQLFNY